MKLREFLNAVNYNKFAICKQNNGMLSLLCKITEYMPNKCLSDKLLDSEIDSILIDDNFIENKNDLFTISIYWED